MSEQHPDPERLWRNRRRMAWLSLFAILAALAATFHPGLDPDPGIVRAALYALCLVVLGYIANCAVDSYIQSRNSGGGP
jgi:hypothetical protein